MNNKSRIALAIAAAFGTVAMGASAQTSTVQIGGSLNMFYQYSNPGGTQPNIGGKKHDNLSLSEPEMWIHGEEKIGSMTAWFRCTSSFDLMGTSAGNTTGAGQFCGRNSALGFKGNFGNFFFGTWDTPMKIVGNETRGWWGGTASLTGGFANVLYGGAGSNTGNTGATFWERRARSINYHSPSFSGFSVKLSTSAKNEATTQTTATLQQLNPRTYGASADYKNGPLYVGLGWERHVDFNPAGSPIGNAPLVAYNGGNDSAWTLAASYRFAFGTRLSGLWSPVKYDILNGVDMKKKGWAIFVDHQLSGPHSIKGQYYKVGDVKIGGIEAPSTGAKGWSLAYMYQFSKRTEAGFVYGLIDNDQFANYTKGVSTAALGATQKNYGLNIRHRF